MTGMVPMDATVFSLPSGRIVSAAGHPFPVWGGYFTTHYTVSLPGTGATLLPVFQDINPYRYEKILCN